MATHRMLGAPTFYCSFCSKSQHEVKRMIAGPTVFICDECTDLCHHIVHKESLSYRIKETWWHFENTSRSWWVEFLKRFPV